MKRYFVDSNVFIRIFVADDHRQHAASLKLLKEAESGLLELVTGPPVFFEVAWTLRRAYRRTAQDVTRCLLSLCGIRSLEITDRDLVESALKVCEEREVEFADAYVAVSSGDIGADAVATFNLKDFKRAGAAAHHP